MENYVSRFLRSALIWLVIGTSIGAAMALRPTWAVYRPAHLHALLLGFMMMMIAGVAYHVIPRFTMAALHSPRLARIHLWVANIGVLLMVVAFLTRPRGLALAQPMLAVGGVTSLAGAWMLAWNLWCTLNRAVPIPRKVPGGRPLPNAH